MPLGYQVITYGNVQSTFVLQVKAGTIGAITLSQTGSTTINVPGLLTTDQISAVVKPTYQAGLAVTGGACLTNGVLTIYYVNASVANITPTASELYIIEINRYLDALPNSIQ
jgi:hypothetical protein